MIVEGQQSKREHAFDQPSVWQQPLQFVTEKAAPDGGKAILKCEGVPQQWARRQAEYTISGGAPLNIAEHDPLPRKAYGIVGKPAKVIVGQVVQQVVGDDKVKLRVRRHQVLCGRPGKLDVRRPTLLRHIPVRALIGIYGRDAKVISVALPPYAKITQDIAPAKPDIEYSTRHTLNQAGPDEARIDGAPSAEQPVDENKLTVGLEQHRLVTGWVVHSLAHVDGAL
jgi:hypothetical protein